MNQEMIVVSKYGVLRSICLNGQLHGKVIETESEFFLTSKPGNLELRPSSPTQGDVVKVSQSPPSTSPPTISSFYWLSSSIKVLLWNCHSWFNKFTSFQCFVYSNSYMYLIFPLTET